MAIDTGQGHSWWLFKRKVDGGKVRRIAKREAGGANKTLRSSGQ
jgi:hypothetical protein